MQTKTAQFQELCSRFNLEKGTINNLLKAAPQLRNTFVSVINFSNLNASQQKIGNLLYNITTKVPQIIQKHRQLLAQLVGQKKIYNNTQLDFIIEYLKDNEKKGVALDLNDFQIKCSIGKQLSAEEIKNVIQQVFTQNTAKIQKGVKKIQIRQIIKKRIPFADGKTLQVEFEKTWLERGCVQVKDVPKKQEKKKQQKQEQKEKPVKDLGDLFARDLHQQINSKQIQQKHEQQFGKKVYTRFPPEPNGYLHIGHAKAMRFSFTTANYYNGHCYLRYDDTNPQKQCQQYIDNIEENLRWMGYKPWKITHASDLFEKLYEYAIVIIKKGKAFVCGQSVQQMRAKRGECIPSKYRDRPIQQNLKLFEGMKLGLYAQGEYSLRAKIDYTHPNPTLRDPVIYRIRYTPHPHTKNKWCIYPLYDYTHPICDSLEGITHSLCTLQFEIRRELYYWVLEVLDIYRPFVWEYSRLNISNTVLSKRKLHYLIHQKYVKGWDDPRILTLNGMKRRGYSAEAINNFCDRIGVTRRGNENIIAMNVLQNQVRKDLDVTASRTMAVIDPVLLVIEDYDQNQVLQVPNFPKDQTKGKHKILTSKNIYVDRSDVKQEDSPNFYGISLNKRVGLKYFKTIIITKFQKENNIITKIYARLDTENIKPKSSLHWIAVEESVNCQVHLYGPLFTCNNPNQFENFLEYLNPQSQVIYKNSKVNKYLLENLKHLDRFQFERKGFFAVDYDTDLANNKIIWNQTVSLLQDKEKLKIE